MKGRIILKSILKIMMCWCDLDSSGSEKGSLTGFGEHCKISLGSTKRGEGDILTSLRTIRFSRRALLHGDSNFRLCRISLTDKNS